MTKYWQITDAETGAIVSLSVGYTAHAAWLSANLPRAFCLYRFTEITPRSSAATTADKGRRGKRSAA